jgi:SAM-dependent methyltransferase
MKLSGACGRSCATGVSTHMVVLHSVYSTEAMPISNHEAQKQFFSLLERTQKNGDWVKVLLSKYRGTEKDLQRITIRPIKLRNKAAMSFVYSYKTCDITKNFMPVEGLEIIKGLLVSEFRNAHLFSLGEEAQLELSRKGNAVLHTHRPSNVATTSGEHDRAKKRFIDVTQPFLTALGITDKNCRLIPSMAGKWKQINKFIEIFSQALAGSGFPLDHKLKVVDFGSGKGYLTFAVYSYLHNVLRHEAKVSGVELREALVDLCNATAVKLGYEDLYFMCGDVKTHAPEFCDVMIALHACDTATDYAIHYGIQSQASIIMCSPCCHKQIRTQMNSPALLKPILQYGVHLGQEAEMVTDTLRALLLQANGYSTKIFEFVSTEHTDKNKMILAVKRRQEDRNTVLRQEALEQITALKNFYAIREHCLESLLQQN